MYQGIEVGQQIHGKRAMIGQSQGGPRSRVGQGLIEILAKLGQGLDGVRATLGTLVKHVGVWCRALKVVVKHKFFKQTSSEPVFQL